MNSKFGMFSVLVLGIMMLLIPATSVANAQEYDDRYYEEQYEKVDKKSYNEPYKKEDERKSYYIDDNDKYKKDDKEKSEEPIIIIKNEPIVKKDKKKKMKEPPMLIVKKDVLYCDEIANGMSPLVCLTEEDGPFEGPDSDSYVQECTDDNFGCSIDEASFNIIVTDDIEFPGSEEGTKLNFNGERFTVTEDVNVGGIEQNGSVNSQCQEVGFDGGFLLDNLLICTLNEGECSGIVQDSELKECTVKNYVVENGGE